jgi:hypothetical protein
VFVNVGSQNINAQIVVFCSRLKSVISFFGYDQIILLLRLLISCREELENLKVGSRECVIIVKHYV